MATIITKHGHVGNRAASHRPSAANYLRLDALGLMVAIHRRGHTMTLQHQRQDPAGVAAMPLLLPPQHLVDCPYLRLARCFWPRLRICAPPGLGWLRRLRVGWVRRRHQTTRHHEPEAPALRLWRRRVQLRTVREGLMCHAVASAAWPTRLWPIASRSTDAR